uniref:dual-specificity kinase n=1 Tax=Wollemia nobilis TaxID=56998 RepID=A0A0C9QTD5_9CONI
MACIADYPFPLPEEHPRKRRRLNTLWDVLPCHDQAQQTLIFSGQGLGNGGFLFSSAGVSLPHKTCSTRNESPPWRDDDKDGHYMFELGDNLTPRYKILSKMGEGTFGQVVECWDRQSRELVAIKIVRGLEKYRDAAMIEIDVLCEVGRNDKRGNRCVQMRNWFDYRNHICIVFEKLGLSLYDFLRKNSYCPFPIDLVREIGRQLLESVAYMHSLQLIHTDLKPENVLFVSLEHVKWSLQNREGLKLPKTSAVKLIDFGSTTFENQNHSSIVSTRHYRAPEVILGLGWSYPCDIWSVGCILVELCTGETLFQTHENLEHLAMMERVLGPLPQHMIRRADGRCEKYLRNGSRLNFPEGASSKESIKAVRRLPRLRNLVMEHADHSAGLLIDLLEGLLKFDPSQRLQAREALNHPFFAQEFKRFPNLSL